MARDTAKRLKQLREIAGLNQFDVADFLDCDRSLVSMIENGYHKLSAEDEKRLTEYLEEGARKRYRAVFADSAVALATAKMKMAKWPACATEPQIFQPTPPPQGPQKSAIEIAGERDAQILTKPIDWTGEEPEAPQGPGREPVEGKARPSCPKCGGHHFEVYGTEAKCGFITCLHSGPSVEFFRPTLPDARLQEYAQHKPDCAYRRPYANDAPEPKCDCGLIEVLASLRSLVEGK